MKNISFYLVISFNIFLLGCEIHDQGFDLGSSTDPCIASGGNCVEPNGSNLLALSIINPSPTVVRSTNNCAGAANSNLCIFDITGLCNEADYPENIIEYRVFDIQTDVNLIGVTRLFNICKRGKYKFQVGLDADDVRTVKRLRVEILGRDLNGVEARNTLAASKDVDLLLIP